MKERALIELLDSLETARIFAGAEMERLCNENKYKEALVFEAVRDNLANNIQLLTDYEAIYGKDEEERSENK